MQRSSDMIKQVLKSYLNLFELYVYVNFIFYRRVYVDLWFYCVVRDMSWYMIGCFVSGKVTVSHTQQKRFLMFQLPLVILRNLDWMINFGRTNEEEHSDKTAEGCRPLYTAARCERENMDVSLYLLK